MTKNSNKYSTCLEEKKYNKVGDRPKIKYPIAYFSSAVEKFHTSISLKNKIPLQSILF